MYVIWVWEPTVVTYSSQAIVGFMSNGIVLLSCIQMEKALVSLALKTEDKASESKEPTSPQNPPVPQASAPSAAPAAQVPTALKGVSQSLLERVGTGGGRRLDLTSWVLLE